MFRSATQSLRYLYFARFSILLWIFPALMAALNTTGMRSLTSGLLVSEAIAQYICIGFFLVCSAFVALIGIRVAVTNGVDRFSDGEAPAWLIGIFRNDRAKNEYWAVVIALLPCLACFTYLYTFGTSEEVEGWKIAGGLVIGTVLSFIFWWPINLVYYVLYIYRPSPNPDQEKVQLGVNAARTILLPRAWFFLPPPGEPSEQTLETASSAVPQWIWRRFGDERESTPLAERPSVPLEAQTKKASARMRSLLESSFVLGYVDPNTKRLYEGPFFSLVAAIGFFAIYLTMWPLTAPVPTAWAWPGIALILTLTTAIIWVLHEAGSSNGLSRGLRRTAAIVVGFYGLAFPLLYIITDAERFPAFASILIAIIVAFWVLGAFAFFFDRYRIPVFTLLVLSVVFPRLIERGLHLGRGGEEHYLSIGLSPSKQHLPTPAEILEDWNSSGDLDDPVVIITATGGGLHASAWTASVLAALEVHVSKDTRKAGDQLYKHVLLASTVSGGSTGLMSYLDRIRRSKDERDFSEIPISASCSSIEAVSWGFIYRDLPVAGLFPLPMLFPSSPGVDDLTTTPMGKDRTWALRRGFDRNLSDDYCVKTWEQPPIEWRHPLRGWVTYFSVRGNTRNEEQENRALNVRGLGVEKKKYPAFTMNTTTSEFGDRFLLANYQLPRYTINNNEALPAESFLQVYGDTDLGNDRDARYPNLPLATAAQLSATFPYVSSASRFPEVYGRAATHFIDGGYYDNDGTVSVIEFLRYALDDPDAQAPKNADAANLKALVALKKRWHGDLGRPVRVILVEIRNDAYNPSGKIEDYRSFSPIPQNQTGTGDLLTQFLAPLQGLWQGGHESVTSRNRAALQVFSQAYRDRMQIHHIIIADKRSDSTGTDPLNWSLTPRQRNEVKRSSSDAENGPAYKEVIDWLTKSDLWNTANTSDGSNQPATQQPQAPNFKPAATGRAASAPSSRIPSVP